MTTNVNFTDGSKNRIEVIDATLDTTTNLKFPGINYKNYSPVILEDLLHLLENFSSPNSPDGTIVNDNNITTTVNGNSISGQLWFDSSTKQLNVFDGIGWGAVAGISKSESEPSRKTPGDLWVDTSANQLKLWVNTLQQWVVVGPNTSSIKNGSVSEQIIDTNNNPQTVISEYIDGTIVSIISKTAFTPKQLISGFNNGIKAGINLNSSYNTYYGYAEKSNSLVIGGVPVTSDKFLRSDVESTTNYRLNIKNNNGLTIGDNFAITLDGLTKTTISNNSANGIISLKIRGADILVADASAKVQLNANLFAQNGTFSGNLTVAGTTTSVVNLTASGNITGNVAGNLTGNVTGNVVGNLTGNVSGNLTGNVTGNISGSAVRLATPRTVSVTGDVSGTSGAFDGSSNISITATLDTKIISNQTSTSAVNGTDLFLISNSNGSQLSKISKNALWASIPTFPAGTVVPYAGVATPANWFLCDGSSYSKTTYAALYAAVGDKYGSTSTTFKVPDLRGRTVVGYDAMGGVPADRVSPAAVGDVGGHSSITVPTSGSQYQAGTSANVVDTVNPVNIMNPYMALNYIIYSGNS